jgi:hypothetical protein
MPDNSDTTSMREGQRPMRVTPNSKPGWLNVETENGSTAAMHEGVFERLYPSRSTHVIPQLPWKSKRERLAEEQAAATELLDRFGAQREAPEDTSAGGIIIAKS